MIDEQTRDTILARVRHQPVIMGILNVTPDSFSDGGLIGGIGEAEAIARRMLDQGASILDVGGESTRPGAVPVPAGEEMRRVLPVIRHLCETLQAPVSIDTFKAETARAAVLAGAVIINDVTGMGADPDMASVVAETGAGVVITYHRGETDPAIDIVADMVAFFESRLALAARAGISSDRIWLDPGVGFAKTQSQNLQVISRLDILGRFGCPVLAGLSRKSFIAHVTARPVHERLAGTLTSHLLALQRGARILRVHDVAEHADMLRMHAAIEGSGHEN